MKTRLWIGMGVAAAGVAAAALFFYLRPAAVPPAETLLPKDTIYYCGTRSPLKVKAAVATMDLQKLLQESAGLTEADSRTVSDWIGGVRGIHAGFRSFTLVPMVLDAAVILEGRFDRPLTGILSPALQQKMQAEEPYRGVAFRKLLLPVRKKFAMELYITDPVQDRILVAFSRRTLTEMIDRMQDGGPSLAGHPAFREMLARKELRRADLIQYVDTAAFLGMFRDWAKSMPQPQFKTLVDLVWNELRLADYGYSYAGYRFGSGETVSLFQINPSNPIHRQFQFSRPPVFPYVPSNACQFSCWRLADPAELVQQFMGMTARLNQGLVDAGVGRAVEPLSDLLEPLRRAFGGNSAELAKLLSGDLAMWQAADEGAPRQPFCFYIGITDAAQVKELIKSLKLRAVETEGICTLAGSKGIAWSVQSNALLIASDRVYLKASLPAGAPSLTDTPDFQAFLKKMPGNYAVLKYSTHEQGLSVRNAQKLPAPLKPVLELFKGCREMQVSRAENGWLETQSVQHFPAGWPAVRDVLKTAFSADWNAEKPAAPVPPPLTLSADEVWQKAIDLLSDGRQSDAEDLIDQAVQKYPDEARILFAKAVLERSRWSIDEANRCFAQLAKRFPGTDWAQAARLSLALDRNDAVEADLASLIRLADATPGSVYLRWLAAIQCRAQKKGELGKKQYEVLLAKFRVGPVMAHHTYANILTEYLNDDERALKHRYIAVSLEAKSWTLQGLANTLTEMERYDEACAVWARAVQLDANDASFWSRWGSALFALKRYEEALDKYTRAARLEPGESYYTYRSGRCLESLRRLDEMMVMFRKAAEQGSTDALKRMGFCYENGKGVERNLKTAADCYRKAVDLDPEDAHTLNSYAWFLATCDDLSLRNYPEAVRLAELSVAREEQIFNLDTLAVAYENSQQYAKAVEAQKRLIAFRKKISPDRPIADKALSRLAKYERLAAEQAAKAQEQQ